MILETKLFPLHGYCLWSLQALEKYIWVVEWVGCLAFFLESAAFWFGKWSWAEN